MTLWVYFLLWLLFCHTTLFCLFSSYFADESLFGPSKIARDDRGSGTLRESVFAPCMLNLNRKALLFICSIPSIFHWKRLWKRPERVVIDVDSIMRSSLFTLLFIVAYFVLNAMDFVVPVLGPRWGRWLGADLFDSGPLGRWVLCSKPWGCSTRGGECSVPRLPWGQKKLRYWGRVYAFSR